MKRALRFAAVLSSVGALASLTGCTLQNTVAPTAQAAAEVKGTAMGGHQPISGSLVTLYKAGTTGYGSAPTVLGTATTDSGGNFTISRNSNTCTDPDQLYIVAQGGDPGLGSAVSTNVLVEALGTCSSITSSTRLIVDELTTVAAAESLSGFATFDGTSVNIGTTAANTGGLKSAMATAISMVPLFGNAQPTTAVGGVVPYTLLNSLANSLSACVNSAGITSAGCSGIATTTPFSTAITPGNTWQIALQWARYPQANVSAVFGNASSATNFFTPTLSSAPHDLSVAIQYKGGLQADGATAAVAPTDVRIDGTGNVWVAGMTNAQLVEFSANGGLLSPAGGWGTTALQAASGKQLAIDTSSPFNLWLADSTGSVWKYTPNTNTTTQITVPTAIYAAGSTTTTTTVAGNPYGISVDASNNVWFGTYKSTAPGYFGRIPAGSTVADTSYAGTPYFATTTGPRYVAVSPTTGDIISNSTGSGFDYFLAPYTGAVTQGATTSNYHSGGTAFTSAGVAWNAVIGSTSSSYNGGYGGICVSTSNSAGCSTKYFFPQPYGGATTASYTTNYFGSTLAIDSSNIIFAPASQLSGGANLQVFSIATRKFLTNNGPLDGSSSSQYYYGDGLRPVDASGASVLASATSTITTTSTSPLPGVAVDPSGAVWLVNTAAPTYPVVQVLGVAAPTGSY